MPTTFRGPVLQGGEAPSPIVAGEVENRRATDQVAVRIDEREVTPVEPLDTLPRLARVEEPRECIEKVLPVKRPNIRHTTSDQANPEAARRRSLHNSIVLSQT